jgi:hypothetical protein
MVYMLGRYCFADPLEAVQHEISWDIMQQNFLLIPHGPSHYYSVPAKATAPRVLPQLLWKTLLAYLLHFDESWPVLVSWEG